MGKNMLPINRSKFTFVQNFITLEFTVIVHSCTNNLVCHKKGRHAHVLNVG